MLTAGQIRFAMRQARHWRSVLWQSVLEDLEDRNPEAAAAAREAIQAYPIRSFLGDATHSSAQAWPYLDAQARADWIWVCRFVQYTWIRGCTVAYTTETSVE